MPQPDDWRARLAEVAAQLNCLVDPKAATAYVSKTRDLEVTLERAAWVWDNTESSSVRLAVSLPVADALVKCAQEDRAALSRLVFADDLDYADLLGQGVLHALPHLLEIARSNDDVRQVCMSVFSSEKPLAEGLTVSLQDVLSAAPAADVDLAVQAAVWVMRGCSSHDTSTRPDGAPGLRDQAEKLALEWIKMGRQQFDSRGEQDSERFFSPDCLWPGKVVARCISLLNHARVPDVKEQTGNLVLENLRQLPDVPCLAVETMEKLRKDHSGLFLKIPAPFFESVSVRLKDDFLNYPAGLSWRDDCSRAMFLLLAQASEQPQEVRERLNNDVAESLIARDREPAGGNWFGDTIWPFLVKETTPSALHPVLARVTEAHFCDLESGLWRNLLKVCADNHAALLPFVPGCLARAMPEMLERTLRQSGIDKAFCQARMCVIGGNMFKGVQSSGLEWMATQAARGNVPQEIGSATLRWLGGRPSLPKESRRALLGELWEQMPLSVLACQVFTGWCVELDNMVVADLSKAILREPLRAPLALEAVIAAAQEHPTLAFRVLGAAPLEWAARVEHILPSSAPKGPKSQYG